MLKFKDKTNTFCQKNENKKGEIELIHVWMRGQTTSTRGYLIGILAFHLEAGQTRPYLEARVSHLPMIYCPEGLNSIRTPMSQRRRYHASCISAILLRHPTRSRGA